jgi:hypothetical protein
VFFFGSYPVMRKQCATFHLLVKCKKRTSFSLPI